MAPSLKITYFDFKGRAEATRLALFIGGISFDDVRIGFNEFPQMKPKLPFGQLPILEVDGKVYCQSEAMLRYCGRLAGLYPEDPIAALEVDMILNTVEDMIQILSPSLYEKDKSKVPEMRAQAVEKWAPYFQALERMLTNNGSPHLVGNKLTIADILVYVNFWWFSSGILDHVPTTVLDSYPKLKELMAAVEAEPKVAEWNKAHAK